MDNNYKYSEITEKLIGAFYRVYNKLGTGFLESVYEKAIIHELEKENLLVENQKDISVYYEGVNVGDFKADLIVENKVIVELKAIKKLNDKHQAQLINYLKATGIEVGLLVNFGDEIEIKRRVSNKSYKSVKSVAKG